MRITILGHASLFFESAEERVLLDPILRTTSLMGSLVHQYPRALNLEHLPKPTLIVITHAHFDHFDAETLASLPKDVPVVIPPDPRMKRKLAAEGFSDLRHLNTWDALQHGDLRFIATPSDAPVKEFGLLVESNNARFWHMSDAEPPPGAASKIRSDYGSVDVVSTKFQPANPQLNFHHNMGSSFDSRAVADWLETACACAPKLAFPYASGLCFAEDRAWLNRYAYPFSAEYITHLLTERLAGVGAAAIAHPGDVISIQDSRVRVERQVSAFVRQAAPETVTQWEPFEEQRLLGLANDGDRQRFEEDLNRILLKGEFATWLAERTQGESALLKAFRDWRAVSQIVVHMGDGLRLYFQIDFTTEKPQVLQGPTPVANYFTHIGADAARRLIAGEASPLEVMIEGSVYIYERLITLKEGHLTAPVMTYVYDQFPDPLLTFAGRRHRRSQ